VPGTLQRGLFVEIETSRRIVSRPIHRQPETLLHNTARQQAPTPGVRCVISAPLVAEVDLSCYHGCAASSPAATKPACPDFRRWCIPTAPCHSVACPLAQCCMASSLPCGAPTPCDALVFRGPRRSWHHLVTSTVSRQVVDLRACNGSAMLDYN